MGPSASASASEMPPVLAVSQLHSHPHHSSRSERAGQKDTRNNPARRVAQRTQTWLTGRPSRVAAKIFLSEKWFLFFLYFQSEMEVNRFITSELFMSTFPPVLFLFHSCLDTRKKKKIQSTDAGSQSERRLLEA